VLDNIFGHEVIVNSHYLLTGLVALTTLAALFYRFVLSPAWRAMCVGYDAHINVLTAIPVMQGGLIRIENKVFHLGQVDRIAMEMSDKAYFEINQDGGHSWVNQAYLDLVDLPIQECLGNGWINSILPSERAAVRSEWESCIKDKRRFSMRYRINGANFVCVIGTFLLLTDSHGALTGGIGSLGVLDCKACPEEWRVLCHRT